MRAGNRGGVGRGQRQHVLVRARTALLRKNPLKIGQRAHVVGKIGKQRPQAGDGRVLALQAGQLRLPRRLHILQVRHNRRHRRTHVEPRTAGRRPETQAHCTHLDCPRLLLCSRRSKQATSGLENTHSLRPSKRGRPWTPSPACCVLACLAAGLLQQLGHFLLHAVGLRQG